MVSSFERAYYANPALWQMEHYTGPNAERARSATEWLPSGVNSVLDAGCGNGILVNQVQEVQLALGLDRSLPALRHVEAPRCQADIVQLPVADNSFDAVVSMEVIEHLPHGLYKSALSELVRVTRRYILLTVPYREQQDFLKVKCPMCTCCFHPYYHMRSFDLADMRALFQEWASVELVRVSGISIVRDLLFARMIRVIRSHIGQPPVSFPINAVCPQCGYSKGQKYGSSNAKSERASHAGREFLRKLWPKRATYRWWMALYLKK